MKNFNELFEEAVNVSDKRKVIFNQLIKKTIEEILPRFCVACESFDINRVYFSLDTKPNEFCDKQQFQCGEYTYVIAIDVKNQLFCDAEVTPEAGWKYSVPESWNWYAFNNDEYHFTRTGIVEFVKSLNNRLENYIKKYEEKNEFANNLLKQ